MAAWRAWRGLIASSLVRRLGKLLFFCWLRNAIFFAGPFPQVNQLATFAAKRTKAIAGIPLMFDTAMRTGHNWRGFRFIWHYQGRLQKVRSNGTSWSTCVDFAA